MGLEAVFAYGMLKRPDVQMDLLGRVVVGVPDALSGWKTSGIVLDGETFLVAEPQAGGRIEGLILPITTEELAIFDDYETDAYDRKLLPLEGGANAWVYVKKSDG